MARLNFIEKFFVKRYLRKWKGYPKNSVFPRDEKWAEAISRKSFYIHRTYNYNSVCVDIYWYVKPSKNEKHIDYIYVRCPWEAVKDVIKENEYGKLPEIIAKNDALSTVSGL